jgi:hypothetical protein
MTLYWLHGLFAIAQIMTGRHLIPVRVTSAFLAGPELSPSNLARRSQEPPRRPDWIFWTRGSGRFALEAPQRCDKRRHRLPPEFSVAS